MIDPGTESDHPPMRSTTASMFTLLSLLLAACGDPCDPDDHTPSPITDTSVIGIACHDPASSEETGGDSESASETSAAPTTADSSSGGDNSSGGDAGPICAAVPAIGEAWGPCKADKTCDALGDDPVFCHSADSGTLCMPACGDNACPMFKCFGGECRPDGACIPGCDSDDDCPLPGSICGVDLPTPMCVFP